MSFTVPDDVLHVARMSEAEMAMELAVILYARGTLPLTRAAEFARMKETSFAHLLASREIALREKPGVEPDEPDRSR